MWSHKSPVHSIFFGSAPEPTAKHGASHAGLNNLIHPEKGERKHMHLKLCFDSKTDFLPYSSSSVDEPVSTSILK